MRVDLLERWMTTVDEIAQVVDGGRLVLYQDQYQMERQCGKCLLVTSGVDGANVRDALKLISSLNQELTNPAQSYEMMIFTSDTKRFLTFLQRLFVR